MGWTRRTVLAGGLAATASSFALAQEGADRSDKIIIAKSGHILAPVVMDGETRYALLDNTQYTAFGVDAPILPQAYKRDFDRRSRKDTYIRLPSPIMQKVGNADIRVNMAVRGLATYTKANGVPVDMIMGANVFESAVVDLDFLAGAIRFSRPNKFADPEKAEGFETKLKTAGRFEIPVSIGDLKGQAIVSLGYGGVIRVHDPKIGDWINDGRPVSTARTTTVFGSVSTKEDVTVFESPPVKLGPFDIGAVRAVADVSNHDGAIATVGVSVLRAFRVWLDGSRNRIWLRPNTH